MGGALAAVAGRERTPEISLGKMIVLRERKPHLLLIRSVPSSVFCCSQVATQRQPASLSHRHSPHSLALATRTQPAHMPHPCCVCLCAPGSCSCYSFTQKTANRWTPKKHTSEGLQKTKRKVLIRSHAQHTNKKLPQQQQQWDVLHF